MEHSVHVMETMRRKNRPRLYDDERGMEILFFFSWQEGQAELYPVNCLIIYDSRFYNFLILRSTKSIVAGKIKKSPARQLFRLPIQFHRHRVPPTSTTACRLLERKFSARQFE
jgi:hypothetical protein